MRRRPAELRAPVALALLAMVVLGGTLLLPFTAGAPTGAVGGRTPLPTVRFASFGSCAGEYVNCSTHPATRDPAATKYLIVAFVHGPTGSPGAVSDSQRDRFHLVSTCWLDNGIFGHTAIFEANVTLRSPATYSVNLTPPAGAEAYLEVALAYNQGTNDRTDLLSNTCANHWTSPSDRKLPASFTTRLAGDLTIYLWVLGQANGSTTPVTCRHGTTTLMACGTPVSGPSYNKGLSWPAFARETFRTFGIESASIKMGGGGCARAPCPWDISYVVLTSDPPPQGAG